MCREKLTVNIRKEIQRRKSIPIGQCWQEIAACLLLHIRKKERLKYEMTLENYIQLVVSEQAF